MKTIINRKHSSLLVIAAVAFAIAPAAVAGAVFHSAAAAVGSFVASMVVLMLQHDYRNAAAPRAAATPARPKHAYPLAA